MRQRQHSNWKPDHTTIYRGRRPGQFSRKYKRGVPGHYAPRGHFALADALWIGRLKSIKRLFGHSPPHIGGGQPYLFMFTRGRGVFYRKLDERGGWDGYWTRERPKKMSFVALAKAVMKSPAAEALRESMARD